MFEAITFLLALYFIALAILAPLGLHRALLLYPARILYAAFSLLLFLVSLGRVRLALPFRQFLRRGKRKSRSLRSSFRDWRKEQEEERVIWTSKKSDNNPFHFS